MAGPSFVGFAGSWSQPSKTRLLVEEIADRAVVAFGGHAHVFDITDLGPDFGTLRQPQEGAHRAHLDAFLAADALIVASPVYKGSYTGLFKHLIDLIDPQALIDRPVLIGATGGGEKHALAVEHQLRPLFGFFEARTLPTAVHVSDRDFAEGRITAEPALTRLSRAVAQFDALFPEHRRALRAAE